MFYHSQTLSNFFFNKELGEQRQESEDEWWARLDRRIEMARARHELTRLVMETVFLEYNFSLLSKKKMMGREVQIDYTDEQIALHCKKKRAMHTKYGVLCLSHLEHLIWRKVMPYFWCVFNTKLGVLSHQLSVLSHELQCSLVYFHTNSVCFHTNSVCFPTNFSVFSHSLWCIFTLTQCAIPLIMV